MTTEVGVYVERIKKNHRDEKSLQSRVRQLSQKKHASKTLKYVRKYENIKSPKSNKYKVVL